MSESSTNVKKLGNYYFLYSIILLIILTLNDNLIWCWFYSFSLLVLIVDNINRLNNISKNRSFLNHKYCCFIPQNCDDSSNWHFFCLHSSQFFFTLKEVWNRVLPTILVWSLFCLIRLYVGLRFLQFLLGN